MARIPEHLIERIKEEVAVVRLAELAGVELRPQGEELIGSCPFHEDDSSSLLISPRENAWRCTGACGAGGSAIEWTMRAEGVSFPHAVELLRDGVVPSTPRSQRATRSTVSKLPPLLPQGAGERELLERVVDFYAQTLRESPEALAYLQRRGLGDPALIERFRLGYANRTLGYRLPAKNRKAGKELRGKLKRSESCGTQGTSTSPAPSSSRSATPREQSTSSTGGRSNGRCGRARRCTSTCPARAASSTWPRSEPDPRRSSASRLSTRSPSGRTDFAT